MFSEVKKSLYRLDDWSLRGLDDKPYAQDTISRINFMISEQKVGYGKIVEIGCGTGDIISHINWKNKVGCDVDEKVIRYAKIHHPKTHFIVGSFEQIYRENISILITINFMHILDGEAVWQKYNNIVKNNNIKRIVVDSVQAPPYRYSHDFVGILGSLGYELEHISKGYMAADNSRRKVRIFRR